MAAAKPKIRNTQISNSGSPPALAAIFSSRWARIEFTRNPARRPILQSTSAWCSPRWRYRVQVSYSSYKRLTNSAHLVNPYIRFLPKNLLFSHFLLAKVIKNQEKQPKKDKML
jgi:hypothetical protein